MLKKEDLRQLTKASTVLGMIWAYAITTEDNELYEKTGVTIKDLDDSMRALGHIHTIESLKHFRANERRNARNKMYPEQHRKHNRDYGKQHKRKQTSSKRPKEIEHNPFVFNVVDELPCNDALNNLYEILYPKRKSRLKGGE